MTLTTTLPDGSPYILRELLTKNAKLSKSDAADAGYETWGLQLAPARVSGFNVCPNASKGCLKACLFTSGHGTFRVVRNGRIAKTRALFQNRDAFLAMLDYEITNKKKTAARKGLKLAVRLNVISDLQWEGFAGWLLAKHSDVTFYDYTKIPNRTVPANYYLTFSRSEANESAVMAEYAAGKNVAVVFNVTSSDQIPATWNGLPVFSGDDTDLRFLDKRGIVGLYAKGQGSKDTTGFAVPVKYGRP